MSFFELVCSVVVGLAAWEVLKSLVLGVIALFMGRR